MVIAEDRVNLRWIDEKDILQIRSLMYNLESLRCRSETLKGQLGFIDVAYKQDSSKNPSSLDRQHYLRILRDLQEVEQLCSSMSRLLIGDLPSARRVLSKMR